MFSALIKAVGYFVGKDEEDDQDQEGEEGHEQALQHKEFTGTITGVYGSYGLINDEIYFAEEHFSDGIPKEGTKVNVLAFREHEAAGWRTKKVTLLNKQEDWDDDLDTEEAEGSDLKADLSYNLSSAVSLYEESVVGIVTSTTDDVVIIDNEIRCDTSCLVEDYIPYLGDSVLAEINRNEAKGEITVRSLKPLRKSEFEGEVNYVGPGYGYINSHIYFSLNSCEKNYIPNRGDKVAGIAIECNKGKSSWRATFVAEIHVNAKNLQDSVERISLNSLTNQANQELFNSKNGIVITESLDFGSMSPGRTSSITISIRNEGTESQLLNACKFCSNMKSQFFLSQSQNLPSQKPANSTMHDRPTTLLINKVIEKGKLILLKVHCIPERIGSDQQILIFEFQDFKIGRKVHVSVIDPLQSQISQSSPYARQQGFSKYKAYKSTSADGESYLIPGQRLARAKPPIPLPNKLKAYAVQSKIEDCILHDKDLITEVPCLGEELDATNYATRFQALLHIEEIQQQINIRSFDMYRVCMRPFADYLALKVPGLAEGRPSVLLGDSVILSEPDASYNSPEYEGYVHEVLRDEILLKFSENMHQQYNGEDFNVRFIFNRTPIRRSHQAAEYAAKLGKEILFPDQLIPKIPQTKLKQRAVSKRVEGKLEKVSAVSGMRKCPLGTRKQPPKLKDASLTLFNKKLNDRQTAAVRRILNGQSRPTPYILFGPPGTGKTVTFVESILQVFTNVSSSRVLVCAPSNSAADLLVERLHESGQLNNADMTRFIALNRAFDSAPETVRQYCQNGNEIEKVVRHRIIICTCSTAGSFYSMKLRDGHFTHVFVDEAGQATEPECMIPIGLLGGNQEGQIVLAGDPMQLGPVLQSKWSKLFGLDQSFLERLCLRELYQRDPVKFGDHGSYDPLLVTKLVENYRSHPVLIEVSSRLFYHDELVVSAEKSVIEGLSYWDMLPNPKNCPLIFHGVRGEDLREGNSPSWFNAVEAVQVMKYLQAVISNTIHPVTFDDVGIITPYKKQVEKIRLLIDKLGMEKVKVGSVEEFQGQEMPVMIISTVRSTDTETDFDVKHNLGFLSNPKRFNVAVTRAQALLIIVGNPHVLSQDPNWLCFIKHCIQNKAYIGCEIPNVCLPVTADEENSTKNTDTMEYLNKDNAKNDCNTTSDEVKEKEERNTLNDEENVSNASTADKITHGSDSLISNKQESKEGRSGEESKQEIPLQGVSDLHIASPCAEGMKHEQKAANVNQSHKCEEENVTGTESNSDSEEEAEISNTSKSESFTNNQNLSTQEGTNDRMEVPVNDKRDINVNKEDYVHAESHVERNGTLKSKEQGSFQNENKTANREPHLSEQSKTVKCEIVPGEIGITHDEVPVGVVLPKLHTESKTQEVEDLKAEDAIESKEIRIENEEDGMQSERAQDLNHPQVCRPKENNHQNVPLSQENGSEDVINISSSEEVIFISSNEEEIDEDIDDIELDESNLTALEKKIIRQVEYYFGDYNIVHDKFLLTEMHKNGGWVSLPLVCTFNKMKELTDDPLVVAEAIRKASSGLLEVNGDHSFVRRVKLLPSDQRTWQSDVDARTVCIEGVPIDERRKFEMIQNLEVYLQQGFGVTEYIGIVWKDPKQKWPRQQGGSKLIFTVVFKKYRNAKAFVEAHETQFEGRRMTKYFKCSLNGRLRANKRQYPWLFNMNKLVESIEAGETESRPRQQRRKQRGENRRNKKPQEEETGAKSKKVVDIDQLLTVTFERRSPYVKDEQSQELLDNRVPQIKELNSEGKDSNKNIEFSDDYPRPPDPYYDSSHATTETTLTSRPVSAGRGVQSVSTVPLLKQFSGNRFAACPIVEKQDALNSGTPNNTMQSESSVMKDSPIMTKGQSSCEVDLSEEADTSYHKYITLEQTDSDVIIESSSEEED